METSEIVKQLYTNKRSNWIINLDERDISPYLIQRYLLMDDLLRTQARWLDKYVFTLPPKMFLSLAWSVTPKINRKPFVAYIGKLDEKEEKYWYVLKMVRKHFKLSDNDYNAVKSRLINVIEKDKVVWFRYYGIKKNFWKENYLNFNLIKEGDVSKKQSIDSLSKWGL